MAGPLTDIFFSSIIFCSIEFRRTHSDAFTSPSFKSDPEGTPLKPSNPESLSNSVSKPSTPVPEDPPEGRVRFAINGDHVETNELQP